MGDGEWEMVDGEWWVVDGGLLTEAVGLLDHAGQLAPNSLPFGIERIVRFCVEIPTVAGRVEP